MRRRALALVILTLGCRRSAVTSNDAAPPAPVATDPAAQTTTATDDPLAPTPRELPVAEEPRDNLTFDTGVLEEPGKTIAAAPKMDPFDQAMNDVRSSAVGCFSGMPPGEYNAAIAVSVTPSGTTSRVEVVSGPDDAAVRKCLESAATRSYPSSEGGRKLTITVRVKG